MFRPTAYWGSLSRKTIIYRDVGRKAWEQIGRQYQGDGVMILLAGSW
jgi:hypothetical protein